MKHDQIIEGNRLIAQYMSIPICDRCKNCGRFKFGSGIYYEPIHMHYNISWDWLMPVVENISKIPLIGATAPHDVCYPITFGMPHTDGTLMVRFAGSFINHGETLIEATWLAVVEFIKYNKECSN